MDALGKSVVADDQERPTELLQQPAVPKGGTSSHYRDLCRQQLAGAQQQTSRLASGEIHDSMAQQYGDRCVIQPASLRRSLDAGTPGRRGHGVPLRNDNGRIYRGAADLSRLE